MKKIGLILLSILLIAAVMCIPVLATGGVTAGEVTAIAGREVELDVYVSNRPEVDSMGIQYTVPEGLSLVKAEWLVMGMGDVETSKNQGVWVNMQPVDLTEKTAVFRFTFMVLEPAANATDLVKEVAVKLVIGDGEWETVTGKVTVTNPATAISISKASLQLDPCTGGETLTASVLPVTTTDKVVWSSSDESVVTVSGGVITVVGEGTATVTARAGEVEAACAVTVSHAFGREWLVDENGHWHKCANGSATTKVEPHDLNWVVDEPASALENGIQHKECGTCGYKTEENTVIPHTHKVTEHVAVAATCVQGGNVHYYTCESPLCEGKFYADAACTRELTSVSTGIDSTNHVSTELQGEKSASCYQNGYTGDLYCNDCKKVVKPGQTTNPTGKHIAGTGWHSDETNHWHSCTTEGCPTQLVHGKHDWTWKEDEPASELENGSKHEECSVCHLKRSEGTVIPHTHQVTEHKAVAATCDKEGNVRYYTCESKLCEGKFYSDKKCTKPLTSVKTPVDPANHTTGTQWYSDGTNHWHLCTGEGCEAKLDTAKHTPGDWIIDLYATGLAEGERHKECSVCGYETRREAIPHTHQVTEHAAVAATCTKEGSVRYYTCASKLCEGKLYANMACTKEITATVVAKDPENHVQLKLKDQLTANCYQDGYSGDKVCTACGKVVEAGKKIPATGRHTADVAYYSDETHHWHACRTNGCEAKVDYAEHSFRWVVDKAATEYETGRKHEVCGCGKTRSEDTVIEKLDHVHRGIQHFDGVAATCVKEGTLEYWTCVSPLCEGKYYGDPECQLELESIVAPVNPKNHTGKTEVKNVKDVTCTEDGYTGDTHCADCGQIVADGEVIPAVGHDLYWVIDRYPTEEAEGSKHQTCNTCGYTCDADTPIEKLEHLPTLVEKVEPTCDAPGVKEHFYCANCGRCYDSSAGTVGQEITAESVVLEALGHSYGTEWTTDEKGHWHSCGCGDKADYAEHTPETVGAEAPAVGKPGYTGDTVCSVCGYKIAEGEQIPAETTAPATTVPPTTQAPATEPTEPGQQPGNGGFWWIIAILVAAAGAVAAWLLLGKRKKA